MKDVELGPKKSFPLLELWPGLIPQTPVGAGGWEPWAWAMLIKLVDVKEFQQNFSKTLKDNAVKVLHSICQQSWKTQQWPQD